VLVARLEAEAGGAAALEASWRALVELTPRKAGCRRYKLHRAGGEAGRFILPEVWRTRGDRERHMASQHIIAFRRAANGLLARFDVEELERLA